ncbi:MAG: hypothetical protein Tsb0020_33210 [Haliangiales bacterium]
MQWNVFLVVAASSTLALAGCQFIVGVEDTTVERPDAAALVTAGTATGIIEPVTLQFEHNGASEPLTITEDGPFGVGTPLSIGDPYTVTMMGTFPCTLENATGVVEAEALMIAVRCGLTDLALSGLSEPEFGFAPNKTAFDADVSPIARELRVIATLELSGVVLEVAGETVASGVPSAPIALGASDTPIDVTATYPNGAERSHRITVRRTGDPVQAAYAKALNTDANDELGYHVAISGDTLVVGAWQEDSDADGVGGDADDNSASNSGAVYVFRLIDGAWEPEAYLKASNSGNDDWFGRSVSIEGDTLAVGGLGEASGAPGDDPDDDSEPQSGAVYVYRRADGVWSQEAYLKASHPDSADFFGIDVDLSGDTLVVGASGESSASTHGNEDPANNGALDSGAVYVYRRVDTTWELEAYLKSPNTQIDDNFGHSVAVVGDVLAAGAVGEDSDADGTNGDSSDNSASTSGAVYIYRRSGTVWSFDSYLKASNSDSSDAFGFSISMFGSRLAVGAIGESSAATGVGGDQDSNGASRSGAVYIFRYTGTAWIQEAYIKASNADAEDQFGRSVSLSGDALAVGAFGEASAAPGVGSDQADNNAPGSGAAYVFRRTGATWAQASYIKSSNPDENDNFGFSVALSDDTLVVGAVGESGAATGVGGDQDNDDALRSGAAYVFH